MATIAKTKISQLATLSAATATTVIPVSDGTGTITTYKITPDNLIKDTAAIAAKADKIGNNVFIGDQSVTGTVYITGSLASTGDVAFSGDLGLVKGRAIEFTDETSMPISKLYFLNNVTSDIQGQINSISNTLSAKANLSGATFTGLLASTSASFNNMTVSTTAIVPSGTLPLHAVNMSQLALKSNLSGGNTFSGHQVFSNTVDISGSLDVTQDVICQASVSANAMEFAQSLAMADGSTILYNSNPIPGEKLLNIKNTTSDVQAQLNSITLDLYGKANKSGGNTFSSNQVFSNNVEVQGSLTVLGEISLATVTNNEIRTLEGIEGNVQVQLDGKPDLSSPNQFSASNIFNAGIVVGSGLVSNGVTYINGTLMAGDTLIMNEQLKTLYGIRIGTGVTIQSQFDSLYYTADDLATNKVDGTERHLHVKLSQTGTNPPTMTILKNTAMPGITLTPIRTGTGGYAIVRGDAQPITGVVTCNKHNIVLRNLEKNMVIETSVNGTQLVIETVDLTEPSTYADNLLNTVLEFTFYNS